MACCRYWVLHQRPAARQQRAPGVPDHLPRPLPEGQTIGGKLVPEAYPAAPAVEHGC